MAEEIRLSKSFIETELPQAPPLYVSVYLMTLAVGQDAKKVAERLKATETDVLYAWGYWKGKAICRRRKSRKQKDLHWFPLYAPIILRENWHFT